MPARTQEKKRKLFLQTLLFGAISAILYGLVFTHLDPIVQLFSRGGYYAVLPIATVFIFSYAHGTFASKLWSVLGIEAVTKQPAKRPTVPVTRPSQRPRPRLRLTV